MQSVIRKKNQRDCQNKWKAMFERPNNTDSEYLIADYLEYRCLLKGTSVSDMEVRSSLSVSDDELDNDGVESSDDISMSVVEKALMCCSQRCHIGGDKYPFVLSNHSITKKDHESWSYVVYTFLLLTTRLNMNTQKNQNGQDATKLFEHLCEKVLATYLGEHSKSFVFGTGVSGGFQAKIEDLINRLHLNALYKSPFGSTGRQKDGNLDVVAWIPFDDKKDSQLIFFGQCKTGDNWEEKLTELQPDDFFSNYMSNKPFNGACKAFFVAESFGDFKWEERTTAGGIFFDRMRIMQYLPKEIDEQLMNNIALWVSGAMKSVPLHNY